MSLYNENKYMRDPQTWFRDTAEDEAMDTTTTDDAATAALHAQSLRDTRQTHPWLRDTTEDAESTSWWRDPKWCWWRGPTSWWRDPKWCWWRGPKSWWRDPEAGQEALNTFHTP